MTTTRPTTPYETAAPAPGFDDPTREAQSAFRAVLDALSHPGRRFPITGASAAPQPLGPELGALALTLLDDDCTAWLAPELSATPAVVTWLTFHTGVRVIDSPAEAQFLLSTDAESLPRLDSLAVGTDEAPHLSATVLLALPAGGSSTRFVGRGPGIETSQIIEVPSALSDFATLWNHNTTLFPRGIDIVFAAGDTVAGLPRTTRLDPQEV
ncbi:phosphonate C-P lyase system protein PhnH [Gordonia jinghuaiqii]|uniref:Phosphonate C-P lyase system protein PhnH n=1 Tax=Gordonia jinghuaiqii TaxID=2758710 RepID=A0A7D7LS24_9ACTN|nr:phosphonate C-P lyase system protein PhnH [Gordonia jinghuaiqii]MCR5977359.1 phosphonate C-P lyase system protein PhnH [Gordonia jinghuaiqii]QMT00061.1 phosphonate C-P lyase system protein PhnH [Gordonia jinghuaiqii]